MDSAIGADTIRTAEVGGGGDTFVKGMHRLDSGGSTAAGLKTIRDGEIEAERVDREENCPKKRGRACVRTGVRKKEVELE